jgi:hypothetical protein
LHGFFREFVESFGLDYDDMSFGDSVLLDIIERVEKRRVYFHIFHGLVMSERNEVALYCFWILKLAPFFSRKVPNKPVNAMFAMFFFLKSLGGICNKMCPRRAIKIDGKYAKNLIYAFRYRDLSKESIMAIAETLLTGAAAV